MVQTLESLHPSLVATLPPRAALFLFTPLCGTCKVARRMLDVVAEMRPEFPIFSVDANFVPDRLQAWHIQSVPALVYFRHENADIEVQYAFSDVTSLYTKLSIFFTH